MKKFLLITVPILILGVVISMAQSTMVDPAKPVVLQWDYPLPDANTIGFKIFKKDFTIPTAPVWKLVGSTPYNIVSFSLPLPYDGTYVVAAYNDLFISDYSNEQTITLKSKPLAPTNLRVKLPQ